MVNSTGIWHSKVAPLLRFALGAESVYETLTSLMLKYQLKNTRNMIAISASNGRPSLD